MGCGCGGSGARAGAGSSRTSLTKRPGYTWNGPEAEELEDEPELEAADDDGDEA